MTRVIFAMFLLWGPAALAATETSATPGEPKNLADRAMKYLAPNDLKGMFKYIHTLMPLPQSEMDQIRDSTISQRKTLNASLGEYVGYAFISECRKFDQVARVTYIEKREKNFIRWTFLFYKPRERWQLSNVAWDNKTAEIFAPC